MPFHKNILPAVLLVAFVLGGCGNGEVSERILLTIGDSNGASDDGWVQQLKLLRPDYVIVNRSIGGNTIGFDNNGDERLNTLRNILRYLEEAEAEVKGKSIDHILIGLGTNDCKNVFEPQRHEVPENLAVLIENIQRYSFRGGQVPHITILSPPPYGPDSLMLKKYHGGDACVFSLLPEFEQVARSKGADFVDVYHPLKPDYDELALDGVHMSAEGQRRLAEIVLQNLKL